MIDINLHLGRELATVTADPVQIEQILLNLGTNAADAMPDGGTLVIETENMTLSDDYLNTHVGARAGEYVLLSVSDTGEGMDKDIPREEELGDGRSGIHWETLSNQCAATESARDSGRGTLGPSVQPRFQKCLDKGLHHHIRITARFAKARCADKPSFCQAFLGLLLRHVKILLPV